MWTERWTFRWDLDDKVKISFTLRTLPCRTWVMLCQSFGGPGLKTNSALCSVRDTAEHRSSHVMVDWIGLPSFSLSN
jgi:hypothetical protein